MANQQMRPASAEQAPDPSFTYERSHPERESPTGSLDNKAGRNGIPADSSDAIAGAITNAQDTERSLTAQDDRPPQSAAHGLGAVVQPDHSMLDEEPLGWDQAPVGNEAVGGKRHPRTGGTGGTPNVGASPRDS